MTLPFAQLNKASFDGIAFPCTRIVVRGEQRMHVHEYPKGPGGTPEILGRKNYRVTCDAFFVTGAKGYPAGLWPASLAVLRSRLESGKTAKLHVPTIGDIDAKLQMLEQVADFEKLLNGERVSLQFEEDSTNDELVAGIVKITSSSLSVVANDFFILASVKVPSIFDQLQSLVNSVIGLINTVQLYGNLLQNKLDALVGLLGFLDATVPALNATVNADLLERFMALRESAGKLRADSQRVSAKLVPFTTPTVMSISDVSRAIYGSTGKAAQILKLNSIVDPLAIPAGETLLAIAA